MSWFSESLLHVWCKYWNEPYYIVKRSYYGWVLGWSVTVSVAPQLIDVFVRTLESVLEAADHIHAFTQNANNQDILLVVRIEDHMAFV